MEYNSAMPSQTSTLSRAEKALVKRNVNRPVLHCSANPKFIEDSATLDSAKNKKAKSQPRGYTFWALVFALCVVALANFFLTITVFSVLRLTKSMENIEVVPTANLIKFFGDFEMNKLIKADGIFSGFNESPVTFTGLGSDLNLKVLSDVEPEITIGQDKVEFANVDGFEIFEPRKNTPKTSAFSTTFPNFGLPKGVQSLHIKKATANRITSKLNGTLLVRSDKTIRLKGNEGMTLRGREVLLRADQDLMLRSVNGSIILDGADGIVMDVDSMAVASMDEEIQPKVAEYKLCICMPAGQLFRIPILEGADTIGCDSVDLAGEDNPCI